MVHRYVFGIAIVTAIWTTGTLAQTSFGQSPPPVQGSFVDPRDGTEYRTVRLGSQLWLGENLRFEEEGSWVYEESLDNESTYGRLYDWEGAIHACPSGWHLPSLAEWMELFNAVGGPEVAGGRLKELGTGHWQEPNSGATNTSRFGGLPGGARRNPSGTYHGIGMFGAFWSSTEQGDRSAWAFFLGYHYPEVGPRTSTSKSFGFSVRCLSDQGEG